MFAYQYKYEITIDLISKKTAKYTNSLPFEKREKLYAYIVGQYKNQNYIKNYEDILLDKVMEETEFEENGEK